MPLIELDRFMADDGMGIEVALVFIGASVWRRTEKRPGSWAMEGVLQ